jgi:hypothetical protein
MFVLTQVYDKVTIAAVEAAVADEVHSFFIKAHTHSQIVFFDYCCCHVEERKKFMSLVLSP